MRSILSISVFVALLAFVVWFSRVPPVPDELGTFTGGYEVEEVVSPHLTGSQLSAFA